MTSRVSVAMHVGLLAWAVTGCSGSPDQAEPAGGDTGSVIARVQLSDTHFVEFREYPGDVVSVIEGRHADLEKGGDVTATFDPQKTKLVALYRDLVSRSANAAASDPTSEIPRLQAIDDRPVVVKAPAQVAAPTSGIGTVAQAAVSRVWTSVGGTLQDYYWFRDNYCHTATDLCMTGFNYAESVTQTQRQMIATFFNQDATRDDAELTISYNTCRGQGSLGFCNVVLHTNTLYGPLQTLAPPHRWVYVSKTWTSTNNDGVDDWQVSAKGHLWGWALIFEN